MKKIFAVGMFVLLFQSVLFAQNATVTATVTDTDSQTWNNGTYRVNFVPVSGSTSYFFNGTAWNPPAVNSISGVLSSSGSLSISSLPRNDYITPLGSQWQIIVCPNASGSCYSQFFSITSASVSLTSSFNAVPAPRFTIPSLVNVWGYNNTEAVISGNAVGASYFNVTSTETCVYSGSSFNCGGGGGGSVSSVFGRTGSVIATTADYTVNQVTGAAPLNNATFTGTLTLPNGSVFASGVTPTWNQNTTGTAANVTATSNATLTTLSALSLPYGQLSGTVPTWNQNTTGNAATSSALATTGSNGQYWGVSGGVQGWSTPSGSGGSGTVNSGTAGQLAYYAGTGTAVSGEAVPTWNQSTTGTAANVTATSNSTLTTLSALSLPIGQVTGTITATQLAAQYSKGSCVESWSGSGMSSALQPADDAVSNNTCYNDSGVTRTITAVKCRSDNASNTTTVNPVYGSAGSGTSILTGAVTCGSSYAYSSSGTLGTGSAITWTTGTGIDPVMGGTLTGTSIAMIVEYTY